MDKNFEETTTEANNNSAMDPESIQKKGNNQKRPIKSWVTIVLIYLFSVWGFLLFARPDFVAEFPNLVAEAYIDFKHWVMRISTRPESTEERTRRLAKELSNDVQASVVNRFKEKGNEDVNVISNLDLLHKSGNEYIGLMTLSVAGKTVKLSVNVVNGDNSFIWEIAEYQ
jgi:hypothetical protein